jgi:hypothetical protein
MRWTVGVLHDSIQEPSGPRVRKDGFSGGVHRSRGKVRARPSGRNTAKVMRPDRYSCRLAAYITTAWLPPPLVVFGFVFPLVSICQFRIEAVLALISGTARGYMPRPAPS